VRSIERMAGPEAEVEDARGGGQVPPERDPDTTPRRRFLAVGLPLIGLLAASLLLHLEGIRTWYWLDETISVGISSHPLGDIPHLLRQDGSPPLYYLVLHAWMALFGTSEAATHSLSLLAGVATVPVALWAGWSLFGRRAGWIAALLAATAPYLGDFGRETRMYTMVALFSVVATAGFVHVFAFGRRRHLPTLIVGLALVVYTHNWGLYLAMAMVAALVPCALASPDRRRLVRDAAVAFGAVALLYLAWLPTLLFQVRHTAAPWSEKPVLREIISGASLVLGDPHERVIVALVVASGGTLLALLRRFRTPEGAAAAAVAILGGLTLGLGWLSSQVKPAWSPRYFAVTVGPLLILAALALARSGTRGVVALLLILAFWVQPLGRIDGLREPIRRDDKSRDKPIADLLAPQLRAGDLVIGMQMEEVPLLAYYLPRGLAYATATGRVADPRVADWRNTVARLEATSAPTHLVPLVDQLGVGHHLLLVCRRVDDEPPDPNTYFRLIDTRCQEWKQTLAADARLRELPTSELDAVEYRGSTSIRLFEKTGA
jgi:hypothetical protein